jgi:LmbE family N-acetylglucosaminyl deacetylase
MHATPPFTPRTVLGVAAHPDDLDFGAGGTIASFAKQGADVYYLILTDGGKGSTDPNATPGQIRDLRHKEQREAGKALGLKDIFFLPYPDGALENTQDVKRDVVKAIRQVRPDVVIALDPTVVYVASEGLINHPDHRAAGQAALDAIYPLARDHMTFPELLEQGYEPHKTPHVLLIRFTNMGTTFGVDISETLDQKLRALDAHASQFQNHESLHKTIREMAEQAGRTYGGQYAEAFVRIDVS